MFKFFCLIALIATVYGVPVPESETKLKTSTKDTDVSIAQPIPFTKSSQIDSEKKAGSLSLTEENVSLVNAETDPKHEEESLEGAEFGWGFRSYGWGGYPFYRSYYYPSYYPAFSYRYYW